MPDGVLGVAAERLTGEDRHRGANPLAAGEHNVCELVGQLVGVDALDDRLEPVFDQRDPALQVLHLLRR